MFLGRIDLEPRPEDYYETRCKKGEYAYCDTQPRVFDPVSGKLVSADTNNKDNRDEYRDEKDLIAQRNMANYALAMFVATLLGVILIYRTLIATQETVRQAQRASDLAEKTLKATIELGKAQIAEAKKSTIVTRRIGETSNAAFVVIDRLQTDLMQEWIGEAIEIKYRNIGKSSAFNIRFSVEIFGADTGEAFTSPYLKPPNHWNNFLNPGEVKSCWFGFDRARMLKRDDAEQIFVAGAILWRDVFRTWRGSRFFYSAPFTGYGPIGEFVPAMAGNEPLESWQVKALMYPFYKKQRLRFKDQTELYE